MSQVQILSARQKGRKINDFRHSVFRVQGYRVHFGYIAGFGLDHSIGLMVLSSIHRSISTCRYRMSLPTVTYGSSRRSLRQRESVETGMLSCSAVCPGVSRLYPVLALLSFMSYFYAARVWAHR